jgi:hypothetical protein
VREVALAGGDEAVEPVQLRQPQAACMSVIFRL